MLLVGWHLVEQLRPFFLQLHRLLMQLPIQPHTVRPFIVHLEAFLEALQM